jgi:hypothetical protein
LSLGAETSNGSPAEQCNFSSFTWSETVLHWSKIQLLGDLMRTVTVRLPAAGFSAAMADMREWLDQNRYEPSKFKYDQELEAVVLSVEFLDDKQGEEFTRRFAQDAVRRGEMLSSTRALREGTH